MTVVSFRRESEREKCNPGKARCPTRFAGLTIGSGANTKDPRRDSCCCLVLSVLVFSDVSGALASAGAAGGECSAVSPGAGDAGEGELPEGAGSCAAAWLVR